ncbi:MAG: D-arabinono-1,4-lactone oxidase, partial [Solirubrobacterales bacterium]
MTELRNWSGYQRWQPQHHVQPSTTDETVEAVGRATGAGQKIRVAGNLHSFSEIARTQQTMISLAAQQGIVDADRASGLVRVRAGTSIHRLSRELDVLGLALPNLGDIDVQSIAGAAATGTHGTGEAFASLSAQIMAARLVTAAGEILEIDESELTALKAARVSLGALGVLTEVTLQCVPAFRLDRLDLPVPLDETLSQLDSLAAEFDHFEFYTMPYTRASLQKRINRSNAPAKPMPRSKRFFDDVVIENLALGALVHTGKLVKPAIPTLARMAAKFFGASHRLDKSFDAFSTVRFIKFNELEYSIPRANLAEAIDRVLGVIEERKLAVNFPIEVRIGRADYDCLLSTAAGRETGYISVHTFRGMEFEPYFHAVEEIMNEYDGRPHWGKINWQT